jgi:hypothetical protein
METDAQRRWMLLVIDVQDVDIIGGGGGDITGALDIRCHDCYFLLSVHL